MEGKARDERRTPNAVTGCCEACGRQVVSYHVFEFADRFPSECPYCGANWRTGVALTWGCSMFISEVVPNDGAVRLAPMDLILQVFGEVDRSCGGGGMEDARD